LILMLQPGIQLGLLMLDTARKAHKLSRRYLDLGTSSSLLYGD
jgi:hypothetical protein